MSNDRIVINSSPLITLCKSQQEGLIEIVKQQAGEEGLKRGTI